ncbi:MAG TPA: manganese-dependent inorganic pyrophosphatase [bacterium]|nr:manganese-dependent inorganic pyrophosphatase [bacterium]
MLTGLDTPEVVRKVSDSDEIYLLDTTNPDEMIEGYENATILSIIDHHKLGGLRTSSPLDANIRAYGCSATILYEIIESEGNLDNIPVEIGLLMLSSIISDTLNLKSPTTTEQDKRAVKMLAEVGKIYDIDSFSESLFEAKSDITGISDGDLLQYDAKEYEFAGKRVLLAVFETARPKNVFERFDSLRKEIEKLLSDGKYDNVIFFLIDILGETGYYLVQESVVDRWIEDGFNVKTKGVDFVELEGVVSRKKQIVPVMEKVIK